MTHSPKNSGNRLKADVIDDVASAIREVAAAEVMPRFRALTAGDIDEKSPGDMVTIADRECERVLTKRLRSLRGVPVVGEEATAADPALLGQVADADAVWIVDPIDGTTNFINGSTDFAVMVALAEHGETVAAWIWHPHTHTMVTAERGAGCWRNGEQIRRTAPAEPRPLRGIIKHRYVPEPARARLRAVAEAVKISPNPGCAGIEYLALIDGGIDFLFYWRTLPWDHAPGVLLATEAGLRAGLPTGDSWRADTTHPGLLTATTQAWDTVGGAITNAVR